MWFDYFNILQGYKERAIDGKTERILRKNDFFAISRILHDDYIRSLLPYFKRIKEGEREYFFILLVTSEGSNL